MVLEWLAHDFADLFINLVHWRLLAAARQAEEMELLASVADRFYTRYLAAVGGLST